MGVWGLEFWALGFEFRDLGSIGLLRVQGRRVIVERFGLRVKVLGFRVWGFEM